MNKKKIAVNTNLMLYLAFFFISICIGIVNPLKNEIVNYIIIAFLSLVIIFLLVIFPLYYVFSDECVEIIYTFGIKEKIKWKEIDVIIVWNWSVGSLRVPDPPNYMIVYPKKKKLPFFAMGYIAKNRRTTTLIKKYYKKEII